MTTARYDTLRVIRNEAGFATLILNRPDRNNTLSNELRGEMVAACAELEADPDVRVLILTGAGRAFTAGMDLDEWRTSDKLAAGAYENDPVAALQSFSGPVIGAINGIAVTGGLEIALACDLLVASTQARFADTHAQVGLLPGWGGSVRMARLIGLNRAKELALTGRFLGAEEALAWGLVNHLVPPEQLMAKAESIAQQMAAAVPETLKAYKRLLDDESALPLVDALALERRASLDNNSSVSGEAIDARVAAMVAARKRVKEQAGR
ncbi:enoyl-CoA hydratase [Variovorax sp. dw_954]|uniref:enoyl-CoA hydratase n=1 Tax=Variovorax sp. dw_954 TaxID=2720078 RepID=UPI001BD636F8|nr:enoyl-CoA hydratase [Variovorax sp. dw_954]